MKNFKPPAIERVKVSLLEPWPNHARVHKPRKIQKLAKSIAAIGQLNPVIANSDYVILSGHARVLAHELLGLDSIDVVRVNHLSEEEQRAFVLHANRIAEEAEWDRSNLKLELELLIGADADFDLELSGFEIGEVDLALQFDEAPLEEPPVPDPPHKPVTRFGDLWRLGEHLLLCGDCRDASNWKRLMQGEKARFCLTDPPFNQRISGHVSSVERAEFAMASGEMSDEQFEEFLRTSLERAIGHTVDGGLHLVAMDHHNLDRLFAAANPIYSKRLNLVVWAKTNAGLGSLYRSQHEIFALYKVGDAAHVNNVALGKMGRHRTNVWHYAGANTFRKDRAEDLAAHPTIKPTDLCADAILDLTHPGDIVIDGFGGSGSVILAAQHTKRRARVIEYEPRFCDVAIQRWEAMTGRKAVRMGEQAPLALPAPPKLLLGPVLDGGEDAQ